MKNRIITVSREFGSGGRTIGKLTANILGIPCYDEELIIKVAEQSGFDKHYIKELGEYTPSSSLFLTVLASRDHMGHSIQDDLWAIQRQVILDIASKESCVIVGRCADYILRDVADCLKVFIHAPIEERAKRIVEVYGEREDKPEKRLADKDKRRKAYYKFYTDTEWGIAKNYDISLDSSVFGNQKCAEIIASLY